MQSKSSFNARLCISNICNIMYKTLHFQMVQVCIVCSIPSTSPCVLYHTGLSLEIRLRALCAHKVLTGLFSGDWFHCLCVSGLCREQLVHQLKLEEKEHEEKLEREKSKKLAELEVREAVTGRL